MADIINLRQARKQKARADKAEQADKNRRLHGRSKAEKLADQARQTRNDLTDAQHIRRLDQAKLDKDE